MVYNTSDVGTELSTISAHGRALKRVESALRLAAARLSTISAHGRALKPLTQARALLAAERLSTISAHGRALKLGVRDIKALRYRRFQQFRLTVEH